MKFDSRAVSIMKIKSACLVVPVFEGKGNANAHLGELPSAIQTQIQDLIKSNIAAGEEGRDYLLKTEGKFPHDYILLLGVGKQDEYDSDSLRRFGGTLASALKGKRLKNVAIFIPPVLKFDNDVSVLSQALVEGLLLGAYDLVRYKSRPIVQAMPDKVTLVIPPRWDNRKINGGIKFGEITAWGQNLARDLSGDPSNYLTPQDMARTARNLARTCRFTCQVLNKPEIKRLKMNCLLAVNSGSARPPHFIIMKYKGPRSSGRPICLVGKGITFDSGGISIKPTLDMDQMKQDMAGSAAVIATMAAAARLKLPVNLIGLVPTTDNMPSGSAYKPGDVLTAMNGKTIEIITTDAEGRLILADGLSYAQRLKPQAIIDVATLTGAAIVALGYHTSAFFTNSDKLRNIIMEGSKRSSEKTWELPLMKEYREQIKSAIADIKNSGGRPGGSCTAAAFLNNFTGDYPWAHIDMAAVDIVFDKGAYRPRGASGYGVRLLIESLRNWK